MDSTSVTVARVPDEEGVDLVVLGRVIRRYWISILVLTLAGFALAVAYVKLARPIYRAETTVAEARQTGMGGGGAGMGQLSSLASLAGVNLGATSAQSREAQAILKSRWLADQFVRRYDLVGKLLSGSRVPKTVWRAVSTFRKDVLSVDDDKRAGTTTVSVYWRDPTEAAAWANEYVALSNELIRNRAAEDARRNIHYLQEELKQTSAVEVQHALYNLVESETKTLMLAEGRAEYAFTVIDPAVPPEQRASPKTVIVVPVGLVTGLFAGM